jgi:hypothetical protein
MRIRERGVVVAVFLAALLAATAPSAAAEGGSLIPNLSPAKGPYDLGIIFNASDLLLNLESYQAGFGVKFGMDKFCIRGLFDFAANGSANALGVDLGATAEYYLVPGPISLYIGGLVSGGYIVAGSTSSTVSFSLGAIAGVEVFIMDFISVFAEYELAADFSNTTDLQSSQSTFDYLVSTRMGNNAKLGIVIYFMRSGVKTQ